MVPAVMFQVFSSLWVYLTFGSFYLGVVAGIFAVLNLIARVADMKGG